MTANISLLSIGNELLDGRTTDTNATFLGALLEQHGYSLKYCLKAADDMTDIQDALDYLTSHSDFIVVSGGLGPTSDDLTRDAIAAFCDCPLKLSEEDLLRIKKYYTERGRDFQEANKKQAYFPNGSKIISNHGGTASGFHLSHKRSIILSLPGVPREFRTMLQGDVLPILSSHFPLEQKKQKISCRLFDMPESKAAGIVTGCKLPESVQVGYRAHFPELEISLSTQDKNINLEELYSKISTQLGQEYIYTKNSSYHLPEVVHQLLLESGKTLALAESCTGGGISSVLTDYSGSSKYLRGGAVTYSNESKTTLLGVKEETLRTHGAVSHETVLEMASGARKALQADLALSVSGIAGPEGGSEEKPVGTFFIGLATANDCISRHFLFPAARDMVRTKAIYNALDLIRRYLLGLSLSGRAKD